MALNIPKEKPRGPKELTPAGTHAARCFSVVDFGHHLNTFDTEKKSYYHHICITWELDIPMADGRPFVVSHWRRFKIPKSGWNEKSFLCKTLSTWLGIKESLDSFKSLLNQTGMVTIEHTEVNGTIYANFTSVVPLPKKLPAPEPHNTQVYFELEPFDVEAFDKLPKWQQDTIKESTEYLKIHSGGNADDSPCDDIPF